jgi:hypothetical protein
VIDRLRTLSRPRRHPRDAVLSQYLEGDIDADGRRSLEDHVGDCARCRQQLASLASAVRALGSLREDTPPGLADSIVAALRAQTPEPAIRPQSRDVAGIPVLTVVPALGNGDGRRNRWPQDARTALRWCLQKPQLRLTVPITLVAGVVLSMVNMGGMLMHGKIDLGVCLSCAVDFIVPFLGLNLALLALVRIPRRRRL